MPRRRIVGVGRGCGYGHLSCTTEIGSGRSVNQRGTGVYTSKGVGRYGRRELDGHLHLLVPVTATVVADTDAFFIYAHSGRETFLVFAATAAA